MSITCGQWSIVGYREDGTYVVHPLRCRSWSCPYCAKRNAYRLLQRLEATPVHSLMTLTCNPRGYQTPDEAFLRMSVALNSFFKRVRRQWPDAQIEYFAVWERTKKGWPHVHLLMRAPYLPQRWVSGVWNELTGAKVVDIRRVYQAATAIHYIAKYLSKDPQVPPGYKRYRSSRHFFAPFVPEPPPGSPEVLGWQLQKVHPQQLIDKLATDGYYCVCGDDGSATCYPPGHPPPVVVAALEAAADAKEKQACKSLQTQLSSNGPHLSPFASSHGATPAGSSQPSQTPASSSALHPSHALAKRR